jgi:hypothetical protein
MRRLIIEVHARVYPFLPSVVPSLQLALKPGWQLSELGSFVPVHSGSDSELGQQAARDRAAQTAWELYRGAILTPPSLHRR